MRRSFVAIVFSATVMIGACSSLIEDEFSGWTLVKAHQTTKNDPLFSSFGLVSYKVYLNTLLAEDINSNTPKKIGSKAAIVVYPIDGLSMQKPTLTGFLEKTKNNSGQSVWKISAVDGNGKPLADETVKGACMSCHLQMDDRVLLGQYK